MCPTTVSPTCSTPSVGRAQHPLDWTRRQRDFLLSRLPFLSQALPMDRKQSLEPSRPAPAPQGPTFGGSRTPSTSDMGEEGRVASGGPPGLETSESLSDSLYDSLSSCGSQG